MGGEEGIASRRRTCRDLHDVDARCERRSLPPRPQSASGRGRARSPRPRRPPSPSRPPPPPRRRRPPRPVRPRAAEGADASRPNLTQDQDGVFRRFPRNQNVRSGRGRPTGGAGRAWAMGGGGRRRGRPGARGRMPRGRPPAPQQTPSGQRRTER